VTEGKKRKMDGRIFFENMAEEDSGGDESDDYGDELKPGAKGDSKTAYYDKDFLKQRTAHLDLDAMAKRYEGEEYDDDDGGLDEMEEYDDMMKPLPSSKDPKLWLVKCQKGFERQSCMSLMNKSIDLAKKGQPLSILSVTCSDKVEQFVYIEAFKEIHVKEAIAGLNFLRGRTVKLIPQDEMPEIYQIDNAKGQRLDTHQWVRVKGGKYQGDLGVVEVIGENKVLVRLIPRIDLSTVGKDAKGKEVGGRARRSFARIPQKLFNPKALRS